MQKKNYDDKFNIMLIGDEGVGKTSIIERYCNNIFSPEKKDTLAVDNYKKEKTIKHKHILIKIWDTVGQEKFSSMTKSHFKIAHGIMLVYSIDNRESFSNIDKWFESLKENCDIEKIKICVSANKNDIDEGRVVTSDELADMAERYDIEGYEISAKTGEGVASAFDKLIKDVYECNYGREKGFGLEECAFSSGGKRGCCS